MVPTGIYPNGTVELRSIISFFLFYFPVIYLLQKHITSYYDLISVTFVRESESKWFYIRELSVFCMKLIILQGCVLFLVSGFENMKFIIICSVLNYFTYKIIGLIHGYFRMCFVKGSVLYAFTLMYFVLVPYVNNCNIKVLRFLIPIGDIMSNNYIYDIIFKCALCIGCILLWQTRRFRFQVI